MISVRLHRVLRSSSVVLMLAAFLAKAQQLPTRPRVFPPGSITQIEDLPTGRLRNKLQGLPVAARVRAIAWLRNFHFTELDLKSLEADADGGIFYADVFSLGETAPAADSEPAIAAAAVPVNPFPPGLLFHSKPGAANVLYLNFTGESVSNTAWNTSLGRPLIPAVAFSTDSDFSTFSDSEQAAIKKIWERVSEDYAPFNIDVTTERPAAFGSRVAHALITRSTDADGNPNPSPTAGGVGYVSVFGNSDYRSYRPSWIYCNNLSFGESFISEAVSHEIGHNLGLSHDGTTAGADYYGGHGSGDTSWGPIMGTGYNRSVSQWSKGDYYQANNTQDDLAIIASRIAYRTDDVGDTPGTATPLVVTGGTNILATTPETDSGNNNRANKGILEKNTDVDVFSFTCGAGLVTLSVKPWIMPSGTRGGNLDISLELRNSSAALLMTNNPASLTTAQIQTNLPQGTYYLYVRNTGTGDPFSATPSGYTSYGSIGQYFISGTIPPSGVAAPSVQLTATVNNAAWGSVSPTNNTYPVGSTAQVTATPSSYYRFVGWTNDVVATNDPLMVVVNTNIFVRAIFAELLTTNHPTPYWWLASHGYTNNFETVAGTIGSNGMPLWQSYIAGLDPRDPASKLRLALNRGLNGAANVVSWNTVTGRVYSLWSSTNLALGFHLVPGATNLASNVRSFTNTANPGARSVYYKLEVKYP